MVILGTWKGRSITLSAKDNSLTISVQGSATADVLSYDREGRLWTALVDGISYRRGLDGKMVAKWPTPDGGRDRRWLQPAEARNVVEDRARQMIQALWEGIRTGEAILEMPLPLLAESSLERAIAFDHQRSQADAEHYHQVYKPVGILPPDQYGAVVLQATEGCAFNTCTFCNFYRDRPFRIKNPQEFLEHARAVKDFIGEGMSLRRTIFLGDANALVTPMPKLLPLFEVTHQVFDVEKLGGIYAFLDGFSGVKKTPGDYRQLVSRGLKRVYVGMESGHVELLKFLRKPGHASDVVNAVKAMKVGGAAVGVIVLLGAGGHSYAAGHVRDTIRVINEMRLDLDDLIYFSELIESEDLEYVRDAYQTQLRPLTSEERIAQGEEIERGLRFSARQGVPHISRYDIREFVY